MNFYDHPKIHHNIITHFKQPNSFFNQLFKLLLENLFSSLSLSESEFEMLINLYLC